MSETPGPSPEAGQQVISDVDDLPATSERPPHSTDGIGNMSPEIAKRIERAEQNAKELRKRRQNNRYYDKERNPEQRF